MTKYFTVFIASWQDELVYRLNFILWRLRNVLRFLMTYFLWQGLYSATTTIYGYSRPDMTSYVFLVLVVQAVILSAPSADSIGGEISNGDLSNYLLKPINYLKYWFTRDIASKCLNISFSILEVSMLWFVLRPVITLNLTLISFIAFILATSFAVVIYFLISALSRFVAFWYPENTWGFAFLLMIFIEIFAGSIFPLDILPPTIKTILNFTPFPYLIYYPISLINGKITGISAFYVILQSLAWVIILVAITRVYWQKGLRVFGAEGR